MRRLLGLLLLAGLAGCEEPAPVPQPHYVVGEGYQMGGVWYYPREDFAYDHAGLAAVQHGDHAPLTADGEAFDPTALAAGHQTVQLPAIARVTNIENGRQILLRINDRGPAALGRILELTPRAAELLQATDGTRIRVQVLTVESRSLAEQLGGGQIAIVAAPREDVQAESLAPPSGAAGSGGIAPATGAQAAQAEGPVTPLLQRMPEEVTQTFALPGALYVDAGHFGRAEYANRLSAQFAGLPVTVQRQINGRTQNYRVVVGPFADVPAADAALDQVVRAGVTDARIVVE